MEKKALGKGLDALLPSTTSSHGAPAVDIQHLRITDIVPNRYQPRHNFPPGELAELTASIKESGVIQPIVVRRKGDGIFELISGERRWRASREAGLETIQAVIRNCSDQEALLLALVENLQREDLNPMEIARAYVRMMNEFGLTQDGIAQKVGCERSSVANSVRLTNLHPDVQKLVESGALSAGHAKVILALESPESQLRVARAVAARKLSVRQTEQAVESVLGGRSRRRSITANPQLRDLEAQLRKRLGTKVTIHPRGQGGKIVIHYFSQPIFDGIVESVLS
ncbi:MAG: ParB/RepB/Spo0J family partition protein [Nitrospiraceae bacterium]